jgi:hypothetical protein
MNNDYAEDAEEILDTAIQKVPEDATEVDIHVTWKTLESDNLESEYVPDVTVKWKRGV